MNLNIQTVFNKPNIRKGCLFKINYLLFRTKGVFYKQSSILSTMIAGVLKLVRIIALSHSLRIFIQTKPFFFSFFLNQKMSNVKFKKLNTIINKMNKFNLRNLKLLL